METILIKLVQLMLSLSILVLVHELGHYLFARLFRVRVDKFYIFFNPWFTLFKYKPKNSHTEWGIGWLPLGGYCKINGMIDESLDTDQLAHEPQPYEFRAHPAWQRLLIMAGGVLFNFLFALIVYTAVAYTWGKYELPAERVSAGMSFSPVAQSAGLRDGDVIVAMNGEPAGDVLSPSFARAIVNAQTLTVRRNGLDTTIVLPPDLMQRILRDGRGLVSIRMPFIVDSVLPRSSASLAGVQSGDRLIAIADKVVDGASDGIGLIQAHKGSTVNARLLRGVDTVATSIAVSPDGQIGVKLRPLDKIYRIDHISYSPLTAVPAGVSQGIGTLTGYVKDMKYVFTKEGAQSMGGFGTIGNLFPARWDWQAFWLMTALLSIILAVMNILPIPALDGGHILFLLIEVFTGRKVSEQVLIRAQMIGMLLLLLLVIYANGNDVMRFIFGR